MMSLMFSYYSSPVREQRPGRLEVAHVYSKRILRWKRNSSPYISGDFFSDMADVVVGAPRFRARKYSISELYAARCIFVLGGDLAEFLSDHGKKLSARVIFVGNDDTEHYEVPSPLPRSLRQIYLQNSFVSDGEHVFTLPIGLENYRYGVNGDPKLFRNSELKQKNNRIIVGPFGNTHETRTLVRQQLISRAGPWDVFTSYIPPKRYSRLAANYSWAACVRGNGIDTHRIWESLYRNTMPIVSADRWSKSLDYLGLPIAVIETWEPELVEMVPRSFAIGFDSRKLHSLWAPWWIDRIRRVM